MSLELITIFVLLAMFIIGSVISVNMGILGMVAAFVVGTYVSGLAVEDIYAAFPIDMFILLTGVTYLFAIALNNGTLDLIISGGSNWLRVTLASCLGYYFHLQRCYRQLEHQPLQLALFYSQSL